MSEVANSGERAGNWETYQACYHTVTCIRLPTSSSCRVSQREPAKGRSEACNGLQAPCRAPPVLLRNTSAGLYRSDHLPAEVGSLARSAASSEAALACRECVCQQFLVDDWWWWCCGVGAASGTAPVSWRPPNGAVSARAPASHPGTQACNSSSLLALFALPALPAHLGAVTHSRPMGLSPIAHKIGT